MTDSTASASNVVFGGNLTFNHSAQEWSIFKERFESMCIANGLTEDSDKAGTKRCSILLTKFEEETYRVARDLVFPNKLNTIGYAALIQKLDSHFESPKCSFAERYKFYKAEQRPGEDLGEWAARVRSLAQFCGFTTELDSALRDRFVLGLENAKEREKLFVEDVNQLTFSRALHLAQATRSARLAMQATGPARPSAALGGDGEVFAMRAGSAPSTPGSANAYNMPRKSCAVCGYKNHTTDKCRFSNYSCKKCNAKGHLSRVCKVNSVKHNNFIAQESDDIHEGMTELFLYSIRCDNGKPMQQFVSMANERVLCEVDSGSAVSVLPTNVYNDLFKGKYTLKESNVRLNCYNGSRILPLGRASLPITFDGQTRVIDFYIIEATMGQPILLGRDFISKFDLHFCNVSNCNNLNDENDVINSFKFKYSRVFSEELGRFNQYKIHLKLKEDAQFKFFKPRPVPLALKPKVEEELARLVELGILEKISHAEMATPIVPVLRPDGKIRICGDYSVTLNRALFIDNYPLPRIEDLFSKLHGGEEFSKLDLSRAYNQCELDESSKNLTWINTHKGLYRYTRLVFGLSSAPCIFQQIIEQLLAGIEGICIFLDDVLITGPNRKVHVERLDQVLSRLSNAGLCLKQDKCELFKNSVEYLGFVIDKHGLHKSKGKVNAILQAKSPKSMSELQSFLGMLNYYRSFVPNASGILNPLYALLKKDCKWHWGAEQEESFRKIKEELASECVLAHYDPALPTILTTDAGPAALGAVLAQAQPDGTERVVAYASRSLTPSEKNYAQVQKEAASLIFGIKKFHYYLYGRSVPFTLRTDHKPLVSIFGCKKGVPELAANRLQRNAIFMSAYNYKIEHINSERNVADYLSRATVDESQGCPEGDLVDRATYINFLSDTLKPITAKDIACAISNDSVLLRVKSYIEKGWPREVADNELKAYFNCRTELSLEQGCILRGHKVIIPTKYREQLLNELHDSHLGVVKTKSEARKRMWWPKIDEHIEQKIGSCNVCIPLRNAPARCPLAPWPYPAERWQRVHLDMCEVQGRHFLIAVDAHSKWVECYVMTATDTVSVIIKLADMYGRYGIAPTLVTDNAKNFSSSLFAEFCTLNDIKHITIAPYHPNSNGQAENSVKFIKKGIKAILAQNPSQSSFHIKLSKLLFDYRNSTHCTTGFSPAQLMLGRSLRTRHDLLRASGRGAGADAGASTPRLPLSLASSANHNVISKQTLQCNQYGGQRKCNFKKGDQVLVKSFFKNGTKYTWKQGIVEKKVGSRMFIVRIAEINLKVKKHADQLLRYKGGDDVTNEHSGFEGDIPTLQNYTPSVNEESRDSITATPLPHPASEEHQEVIALNSPLTSPDASFESVVTPDSSPRRLPVEEEGERITDLLEAQASSHGPVTEEGDESDELTDEQREPNNRRYPIRSARNKASYKFKS